MLKVAWTACSRIVRQLHTLLLWVLWLFLAVIWIATLAVQWREGARTPVLLALLSLGLLVLLYFAEGIELAVTDLLDKEPEQLHDPALQAVLEDIQRRSGFFFAQRQVFVVAIIAFTSLVTTYPWVIVPFVGKTAAHNAPFWFSLVFTTFTVLWFCQVTPKRLAILNSELFLRQSRFVWRLIQLTGMLGLPNPSDWLVAVVAKHSGYAQRRNLLPSRAAHHTLTSQLEGMSLERIATDLTVDEDAGRIVKKVLVLFLHGRYGHLSGELATASAFTGRPTVTLLGLYTAPQSERGESLAPGLDAIFGGSEPPAQYGLSRNLAGEWRYTVDVDVEDAPGGTGQRLSWTIAGELLPEAFWPAEDRDRQRSTPAVVLLYQVEASVAARGFWFGEQGDTWSETITEPCRSCSLHVRAAEGASAFPVAQKLTVTVRGAEAELSDESAKYTQALLSGHGAVNIPYPLQGGTYMLSWRVLSKP
jgi:hypothetical protein